MPLRAATTARPAGAEVRPITVSVRITTTTSAASPIAQRASPERMAGAPAVHERYRDEDERAQAEQSEDDKRFQRAAEVPQQLEQVQEVPLRPRCVVGRVGVRRLLERGTHHEGHRDDRDAPRPGHDGVLVQRCPERLAVGLLGVVFAFVGGARDLAGDCGSVRGLRRGDAAMPWRMTPNRWNATSSDHRGGQDPDVDAVEAGQGDRAQLLAAAQQLQDRPADEWCGARRCWCRPRSPSRPSGPMAGDTR